MSKTRSTSSAQMNLALPREGARVRKAPMTTGCKHRIAGLFAGVGGIELGMHRAGHSTALLCESDDAAMAVLKAQSDRLGGKRAIQFHGDVIDLKTLPAGTTLITAGFPCQDLSQAGATKGIAGSRSGLVGEVFRLIRTHDVPWVLLENVPFMLQLARGEAMNVITTAFEDAGYRWAYRVMDSRAFGLPQRRRRVYFLASKVGDPREILFADDAGDPGEPKLNGHPVACGFYWTEGLRGLGWAVDAVPTLKGGSTIGIPSPPAILMPDKSVVTPDIVDAERLQGFPPNWTKPAEAVTRASGRWKLVGNAVSVRAAAWIGRRMARPGSVQPFDMAPIKDHHWPTAAWNVGEGRMRVFASEWPVRRRYKSLHQLLNTRKAKKLSFKATRGFLLRADRAQLQFPPGFIAALEAHRDEMASAIEAGVSRVVRRQGRRSKAKRS